MIYIKFTFCYDRIKIITKICSVPRTLLKHTMLKIKQYLPIPYILILNLGSHRLSFYLIKNTLSFTFLFNPHLALYIADSFHRCNKLIISKEKLKVLVSKTLLIYIRSNYRLVFCLSTN